MQEVNILSELGILIFEFGFLLIFSLFISFYLKRFGIPAVLGLIIAGLVLGLVSELGVIIPRDFSEIQIIITELALAWIGFDIGNEINLQLLRSKGKGLILVLFGEAFGAFFIVLIGIFLLTGNFILAFILAAIAMATAPASTSQILGEYNAKGELSQTTLFVLAFDDLLAILLVTVGLGVVISTATGLDLIFVVIQIFISEIAISLTLGIGAAFIFSVFRHFKIVEEDKAFEWVLGLSILIIGITMALTGSTILTMFIFGMVLKSLEDRDRQKRGHDKNPDYILEVETLMIPIVMLFFILVGLEMDIALVIREINNLIINFSLEILGTSVIILTLVYFTARFIGKAGGSWLALTFCDFPSKVKSNLPFTLITQAGVAIGLASLAFTTLNSAGFETEANLVLITITISVILAELIGPYFVKRAIFRAGEANGG